MKCFYCGRPYTLEQDRENPLYRLVCKFPRCKAQPCSDYHPTEAECERDMIAIKDSWRNAGKKNG